MFGAAALFVFLVLVAQYESWTLPLAIVMIVPMCLLASVTGLLARGMPPRDALVAAVYLHGLAGDLATARLGEESLVASDLVESLPDAFAALRD